MTVSACVECVCTHVCVHVHACRGWGLVSGSSITVITVFFFFHFLRQDLSWKLAPLIWQDQLSSKPQGSPVSASSVLRLQEQTGTLDILCECKESMLKPHAYVANTLPMSLLPNPPI